MSGPRIYSPDNPFVTQQQSQKYSADNPFISRPSIDHPIEQESIGGTFANYAKYIWNLQRSPSLPTSDETSKYISNVINVGKAMGHNLATFSTDVASVLGDAGEQRDATINKYLKPLKEGGISNPLSLHNTVLSLAALPIQIASTITQTKPGPNGEVVPASIEEQTRNMQGTLGMILAGATASKVAAIMESGVAESMALKPVSYPGLLLKSAYPKAISGLAAGGVYGGTEALGQDEQLAQALSSGLAFGAIGMLWRPFKRAGELGKEVQTLREAPRIESIQNAAQLAATRGLQITPEDTPLSAASKVKAFSESDNAVQAYIGANLEVGKQVILQDLPKDVITRLTSRYMPSPRASEGIFRPSDEMKSLIDRTRLTVGPNTYADLVDPFDKAIMISEKNPSVLKEIKDNTGLTDDEIKSHRWYIKEQIKESSKDPNNLEKLGPNELAQKQQEFIDRGKAMVNVSEGQSFQDANGNKWLRVGNTITNGAQALDVNSIQTHKLLGTDLKFNPNSKYLRLGKQDFSPEYGREAKPVNIYNGPNNTTLVSSYPLAKTVEAFFSQTGYLPNELVTAYGRPHTTVGVTDKGYVQLRNSANGRVSNFFPSELQRIPKGLDSEFYKASNGEQITRMGVYNRETYFNNLYENFRLKFFNLDEEPQEAYNKTIMKYANEIGMKNVDDINSMASSFVSRMMDEVVDTSDLHLKEQYNNSIKALTEWNKNLQENTHQRLSLALSNNNMSLTSRGGGIYDIKDQKSGTILQTVRSLQEAEAFIQKSGQAKAYDLDGGFTQGNPVVGGTLDDTWIPTGSDNRWNWIRAVDKGINAGVGSKFLARQRSAINEMDQQSGYNFRPHFQALQHAQNTISNLTNSPAMKVMIDKVNDAIKAGSGIGLDERIKVHDWLTFHTSDQLIKKFNLTHLDEQAAQGIAKVGSGDVIDFMNKIREQSNYNKIGSNSFNLAFKKLSTGVDPDVVNVSKNLFSQSKNTPTVASTLKLAQVLEHGPLEDPTPTLSSGAKKYMSTLEAAHGSLKGVDDPFWSYGPHSKLAEITGYDPFQGHSPGFQRSYNKLISTPANQIETDPSNILYNMRVNSLKSSRVINENLAYFNGSNNNLSFNEVVQKAQEYINTLHERDTDTPETVAKKRENYPIVQYLQQHLDDVKGIPDQSKQLANAAQESLKEMYGPKYQKMPDFIRLGASLVYSSLLGLRSAFTVRDIFNAHQNVYIFAGPDAAIKVFGGIWSKEMAQKLIDDGKIPATKGLDLLNPGEDVISGMSRLSKIAEATDKLSNWATKWNGQQLGHVQMNTGIYMYYFDKVGKLSSEMLKNQKSKVDAYTELNIQKIHPTEQKMFDDLISAGRTDQAGDFLARNMVDRFNVIYGRNNAPQAWRTQFGKLAGGFGQWAASQVNTNIDHFTRGTRKQVLQSIARATISNTAIMTAGAVTGINLSRWTIMPYNLPGISPLMSGLMGVPQDMENALNLDPAISNPAGSKVLKMLPYPGNWAHLYLPGSYFLQNELDSWDMMQGDFGPVAVAKGILGLSTINSTRSPLQNALGLEPEWKGRVVPDKGVGPGILNTITK